MPQKRLPILHKVSNYLKFSIFITKMRKPIIQKLIFLKKSRKLKRFKLLKHYNYGSLEEYQFTPSSTPLIHYQRKQLKNRNNCLDIYSMFFLCRSLGSLRAERGGDDEDYRLDALPSIEDAIAGKYLKPYDAGDDEDSVDQRAERFIERFYEEMRMQRQDSF